MNNLPPCTIVKKKIQHSTNNQWSSHKPGGHKNLIESNKVLKITATKPKSDSFTCTQSLICVDLHTVIFVCYPYPIHDVLIEPEFRFNGPMVLTQDNFYQYSINYCITKCP